MLYQIEKVKKGKWNVINAGGEIVHTAKTKTECEMKLQELYFKEKAAELAEMNATVQIFDEPELKCSYTADKEEEHVESDEKYVFQVPENEKEDHICKICGACDGTMLNPPCNPDNQTFPEPTKEDVETAVANGFFKGCEVVIKTKTCKFCGKNTNRYGETLHSDICDRDKCRAKGMQEHHEKYINSPHTEGTTNKKEERKRMLNFLKLQITQRIFTRKELLEHTLENFPQFSRSAIDTILSDCKNPKYNPFDTLVVTKNNLYVFER